MEDTIIEEIGIDPIVYIVILFLFMIVLAILFIVQTNKYNRLNEKFQMFMTGLDGASLEEKTMILFSDVRKTSYTEMILPK